MKIGILKADAVPPELAGDYGQYADMFRSIMDPVHPALELVTYDVEEGRYPADIDEVDAYLITGSKSSVYDDKAWIYQLADFVRQLHQRRKKLVGICFGHQMVAHALGGKVEKSDKGWGLGAHSARFFRVPDWHDGEGEEFHLLVSHQDQVTELAPGTAVLAGSDFCENAVCQLGDHVLTFQGHPEFSRDFTEGLLNIRREAVGEDNYVQAMSSLSQPVDRDRVARWIVGFLNQQGLSPSMATPPNHRGN